MKKMLLGVALAALAVSTAAAQDKTTEKVGDWTLIISKDAFTDKGRGIAGLEGQGGMLIIKCDSGGSDSSMYVDFHSSKYLGSLRSTYSSTNREVMFRFDEAPVQKSNWFHDGRDAIMSGKGVSEFVVQLVNSKKVAIRATTFDYEVVTATFAITDTAQAKEAISRAYKACGQTVPF